MRTNRVVVGTPLPPHCQLDVQTAQFCVQTVMKEKWIWEMYPSNNPDLGRNSIITRAFENKRFHFTHIFFIDADTIPPASITITRLLDHNKDIVSAVTPIIKKDGLAWNVRAKENTDWIEPDKLPEKIFTANCVGSAAILIRRNVLEKMSYPYFDCQFPEPNKIIAGDIYFCNEAKKLGFDIWIDPLLRCGHRQPIDLRLVMSKGVL